MKELLFQMHAAPHNDPDFFRILSRRDVGEAVFPQSARGFSLRLRNVYRAAEAGPTLGSVGTRGQKRRQQRNELQWDSKAMELHLRSGTSASGRRPSPVARQPQQCHPWIGQGDPLQRIPGAIPAAVIDIQDAAIDLPRAQAVEHRGDSRMQRRQGFGLVIGGNDDSEQVSIHRPIVAGASRFLT